MNTENVAHLEKPRSSPGFVSCTSLLTLQRFLQFLQLAILKRGKEKQKKEKKLRLLDSTQIVPGYHHHLLSLLSKSRVLMSQTLSLGSWFLARHKQMQSRWLSNIQLLGSAHIYWLWAPFGHWVMGFHTAFFFFLLLC